MESYAANTHKQHSKHEARLENEDMNTYIGTFISSLFAIVFVTGCSSSGSETTNLDDEINNDIEDPASEPDNTTWVKINDDFGYNLGIYEKDGVVYTSTHATRDGTNFEPYNTPQLNFGAPFRLLSYIDENTRYYLFQALAVPTATETTQWTFYDWAQFGDIRYMAGTSDHLISTSYQAAAPNLSVSLRDPVEYSENDAQFWQPVELDNGDNIFTNGLARPADNKSGTILLTDRLEGAWLSNDGGHAWSNILLDMDYIDVTIGSDDYVNDFYAISTTAGKHSADRGVTWTDITLPDYEVDRWLAGTVDSANGDVVIWGLNPSDGDAVFRSSDKGMTWEMAGSNTDAAACELCAVPDIIANEHGYFLSANALYFLSK